jgi:hypothetical protein
MHYDLLYMCNKNQQDALYFQFILIINLYLFQASLLFIIRLTIQYPNISTTENQFHTNCCIYRIVPPDDEQ